MDLRRDAIRTFALVLSPEAFDGLIWTGGGNRYHVSGAAWVVLPPNGLDGMTGGPTDLKTWAEATTSEEESSDDPVKLTSEGSPPIEA